MPAAFFFGQDIYLGFSMGMRFDGTRRCQHLASFDIRTTDVTGTIELPEGVEMVMPGDNTKMKIKLIYPVALEKGLRFAIREGGKTVGAGAFSKILE